MVWLGNRVELGLALTTARQGMLYAVMFGQFVRGLCQHSFRRNLVTKGIKLLTSHQSEERREEEKRQEARQSSFLF